MSLLLRADARHIPLADGSVHCCVTSPPYWGLRDYGLEPAVWDGEAGCEHAWGDILPPKPGRGNKPGDYSTSSLTNPKRQDEMARAPDSGAFCRCGAWRGVLGLEPTIDLYVSHIVEVFREVRRVLRPDGTLWCNLGDSYASTCGGGQQQGATSQRVGRSSVAEQRSATRRPPDGLKPKDLCGIPWRVAFALQDDGWWLRSDIIWAKPNPMPESVTDRPTKAHEYLFLLAKSERYFYDAEAVAEPAAEPERERADRFGGANGHTVRHGLGSISTGHVTRNKRTVWTIPTNPYGGAHFATFPSALVEPCIHAGCPEGGIVLDPFGGSGVVAATAFRLGRRFVHVDLKYHELARERIPPMAFLPGIQSPTEEVLTR